MAEVAASQAGALTRTEQWAGLKPGDAVEVRGTRLRSASWSFMAHVANPATNQEWVEVVGGKSGDRKVRSFRPEQVFPYRGAKHRGEVASLADSPQLPFG